MPSRARPSRPRPPRQGPGPAAAPARRQVPRREVLLESPLMPPDESISVMETDGHGAGAGRAARMNDERQNA